MITSITLEGFKSFGDRQTVPLEAITVLVGPNNSGKSNFLSVGRLLANAVRARSGDTALAAEGGREFVAHRPALGGVMLIEWHGNGGIYSTSIDAQTFVPVSETLTVGDQPGWTDVGSAPAPFKWLLALCRANQPDLWHLQRVLQPLLMSREVRLSTTALTKDAQVVEKPTLGVDGSDLAAVLGLWRGGEPEKADQLEKFLRSALPELKHVLVKPSPQPGFQRLWVEQTNKELFDSQHVSDGVLHFIALAMHAVDAPEEAIIFVEDPEDSIHPRRLSQLVDLLRTIVQKRKCQFVLATHSPVLLNEFRNEPEAIVLFRRGDRGTVTRRLTDLPDLLEALKNAEPGELLANGFFNDPF